MISVCMASFNGEQYIKEQLDSIFSQLGEDDELIVSDDSSTDKTIEIIKSYGDHRVRLLENQSFSSPIFNFENALKYARGDIILLADQDDIWAPDKVSTIKRYMKNYDLVVSDAKVVDEFGNVLVESFYRINASGRGLIKNIAKNSYLGCALAFNRKVLNNALPFPADCPMHDWWLGLVAETCGDVYFIEDKLISYRKHRGNFSLTGEKSRFSLKTKLSFRLSIIRGLIKVYYNKS